MIELDLPAVALHAKTPGFDSRVESKDKSRSMTASLKKSAVNRLFA